MPIGTLSLMKLVYILWLCSLLVVIIYLCFILPSPFVLFLLPSCGLFTIILSFLNCVVFFDKRNRDVPEKYLFYFF